MTEKRRRQDRLRFIERALHRAVTVRHVWTGIGGPIDTRVALATGADLEARLTSYSVSADGLTLAFECYVPHSPPITGLVLSVKF